MWFCCIHTRPVPLALFEAWGSHLLGAPPRPTGAFRTFLFASQQFSIASARGDEVKLLQKLNHLDNL
ncbi:hypothetical protein EK904_009337 [Melospiza melodia maxima]|nr:hypothetical protein EK904_009337 [Melospiza melodia maxima]